MNQFIFILSFFSFILFSPVYPNKTGFIDMDYAIHKINDGISGVKKIKDFIKKEENKIKYTERKYAHYRNTLQQNIVSNDTFKKKYDFELQHKLEHIEQLSIDLQKNSEKKFHELNEKILRRLSPIVQSIAKKYKYCYIFNKNKNIILYSSKKNDITKKFIKKYNETYTMSQKND